MAMLKAEVTQPVVKLSASNITGHQLHYLDRAKLQTHHIAAISVRVFDKGS
ncbi:hypothetical protein NOR_06571 [Metarhizium rileyi]|uniref:Uncharacterized protein n=1 Tax=Metarhizium rileyi (strain RCEF 4871) TaxID=1649241 RepID=A0A167A4J2_METRR|nr:hypothetical protein NOR_06571 [Metarhizium rileyi RCEF 4871]